jgi:uncharacterized membrane protein YphA (DoxX/SURF4 family)
MRYVFIAARVLFGLVFIWASFDKILNPDAFAQIVYNYQVLPDALVNPVAIFLPWFEMICGVLLVIGRFSLGAGVLLELLLLVFVGLLAWNAARGLDVACGCFTTDAGEGNMAVDIVRDLVIMAVGALGIAGDVLRNRH